MCPVVLKLEEPRDMQTPTFLRCIPSQEMRLLKQHQLRHWVTLTKAAAEIVRSQICSSPLNTSTWDTEGPLSSHILPSSGGILSSLSTMYPEIKMKMLPCNSSSTDLQGNKGLTLDGPVSNLHSPSLASQSLVLSSVPNICTWSLPNAVIYQPDKLLM